MPEGRYITDLDARQIALDRALQFHSGLNSKTSANELVETALKFWEFLTA